MGRPRRTWGGCGIGASRHLRGCQRVASRAWCPDCHRHPRFVAVRGHSPRGLQNGQPTGDAISRWRTVCWSAYSAAERRACSTPSARRCPVSEGTRGQTLLTDVPSPTSPTALARRGWFAAVAAAGTTLLAKLTWPDRAEAQGTPLQVGLPNGATATTTLTGTFPDTLLSLSGNGSAVGLRIENSQTSDQAQPAVLVLG